MSTVSTMPADSLTPLSAGASAGTVKTNLYFHFYTGPRTDGHCPDNTLSHIMARGKNWSISENRTHSWMQCTTLQWHPNEHNGVSNHQPRDCLLNRLFRYRWKKTSKLHVIGLCVGNSPLTGEFPAQRASNTENVSIWWRHHESSYTVISTQIFSTKPLRIQM